MPVASTQKMNCWSSLFREKLFHPTKDGRGVASLPPALHFSKFTGWVVESALFRELLQADIQSEEDVAHICKMYMKNDSVILENVWSNKIADSVKFLLCFTAVKEWNFVMENAEYVCRLEQLCSVCFQVEWHKHSEHVGDVFKELLMMANCQFNFKNSMSTSTLHDIFQFMKENFRHTTVAKLIVQRFYGKVRAVQNYYTRCYARGIDVRAMLKPCCKHADVSYISPNQR